MSRRHAVSLIVPTALAVPTVCALVLGLLYAPPLLASRSSAEKTVRRCVLLCQRGERALATGHEAKAERYFRNALVKLSSFPPAHIGLGHLAIRRGDYESALVEYRSAALGFRELGEALFEIRARQWANSQRNLVALYDTLQLAESGRRSNRMNPLQISKIWNAITHLEALEQPDRAAATQTPAEVHFFIGNALFQLGRYNEALEEWLACKKRNPAFAMVYNNLALAYWRRGEVDQAVRFLTKAEQLGFPVDPSFKNDLIADAR